jgi:hypothetical protein
MPAFFQKALILRLGCATIGKGKSGISMLFFFISAFLKNTL